MNDDRGPSIRVGDVIAGKYRVERVLGRGAMGVVVAAMHLDLGELRAIKFMSAEALEEPGAAERFLREAKAASRLKSQYVARVYDVGRLFLSGDGANNVVDDGSLVRTSDSLPLPKPVVEDGGRASLPDGKGAPYIVMEHLEGVDLRVRLKKEGPLSVDEVVLYLVQACEAIGEAHAAGIVHRDLKPGNLFLTTGVGGAPVIKVFDFGIAKVAQGLTDGRDLTATAALLGTPKYMSPEQMRAERNGVDARSDIWALGVTIYNLLTRKMPFEGDSIASLCSAVMWEEPVPLSKQRADLPAGIEAVVARCLAKDPAKRFQTAAELAEALLPLASEDVRRAAPRVLPPSGTPLPAPRPVLLDPIPPAAPADAATGAPWAHATGAHHRQRSGWSVARVGGVVALLTFGLTVGGIAIFTRIGRSPAPAVSAVAAETIAPVPPPPPPEPSATATAAAPAPTVTPAVASAVAPALPVAAVDAGAPHPTGSAKPGGGQGKGHGSADPFWSSRR